MAGFSGYFFTEDQKKSVLHESDATEQKRSRTSSGHIKWAQLLLTTDLDMCDSEIPD